MRRFTIITNGETITEVEADRMAIDGGIVSFWEGAGDNEALVGLSRDWSVISSAAHKDDLEVTAADIEATEALLARVSGVSDISRGELPELPDPFDSFPDDAAVNPHLAEMQAGQAYVDAQHPDPTVVDEPAPDAPPAKITQDIVDGLNELDEKEPAEASEPDAPGVSTDPDPEPETAPSEDDVDANPPAPSPSESTDADHPSAEGEVAEMDRLLLQINAWYAEHRQQQILTDVIVWMGEREIPVQPGRMDLAQRRAVVAKIEGAAP